MNLSATNKSKTVQEKLSALHLFHTEGMSVVEKMYPQHKKFVLENQGKSTKAVRQNLLSSLTEEAH